MMTAVYSILLCHVQSLCSRQQCCKRRHLQHRIHVCLLVCSLNSCVLTTRNSAIAEDSACHVCASVAQCLYGNSAPYDTSLQRSRNAFRQTLENLVEHAT